MKAVAGISEHNGWAELVTLGTRDGVRVVLDRRRVELIASGLPCNPYHHEGLELPLAKAEKVLEPVRRSVTEHARKALSQLQSSYTVAAVSLQKSPFEELPDSLGEVLESWRLTCAADGMMYRESLAAVAAVAAELGMQIDRYPRKSDQVAAAAEILGIEREAVAAVISELGRRLGPPWKKEHRNAAASALRVMAQHADMRL